MRGLASVGDILAGKYKVERILGIGGMGMVVLATHLELEQSVAIKFMLPAALENPESAARFMREARAAGRLTSEHVCRVSDVGRFDSGIPYIVMEYLEGYDLGTLLKRKGPLPVSNAVDYILQAAEGMAEAHGHGIVHRDLKPDNLFLASRSDGSQIVKVLDFGISKASVTGIATKTGDIMGSPAYMAPEQMQSTKDVDERADVWSLGVILYQLISGRMPFVADTLPALCLAVINDAPPSLESIRKDLPHGLAQVVMKCLAKHKDERFRNVHELAQSLAPYGKPESAGAVTRIRSMLQRKRPHTSTPPLMMLPSEFSDVAPTLIGTSDSLDVPKIDIPSTPLPPKATQTTIGSSSGESLSLLAARNGRVNRGVIGALLGAIALVALIIAMVLIKRGNSPEASAASNPDQPLPSPPLGSLAPDVNTATPPPPATDDATPQIIDKPLDEELIIVEDNVPPPDAGRGSTTAKRDRDRDRKKTELKEKKDKEVKAGSGATEPGTSGSNATPPPPPKDDDEDIWGHMQHDGSRKEPAPPKKDTKDTKDKDNK